MIKSIVLTFCILLSLLLMVSCLNDTSESENESETEDTFEIENAETTAKLDADYVIDYNNGTVPIGDLAIGTRVVDPAWEWEFRTGNNYSGNGTVKPITWLIVAKDHYEEIELHVTLLAEEVIGKYPFDDSTNRGDDSGSNHWGDSGTENANRGLRLWLNSTGIHTGEGFYMAFSDSFKAVILTTTVPNKEKKGGNIYNTQDKVFIPSSTELGDKAHRDTYQIGNAYPYFESEGASGRREAILGGDICGYWLRSPDSIFGSIAVVFSDTREFRTNYGVTHSGIGVRPVLNIKSDTLVTSIQN